MADIKNYFSSTIIILLFAVACFLPIIAQEKAEASMSQRDSATKASLAVEEFLKGRECMIMGEDESSYEKRKEYYVKAIEAFKQAIRIKPDYAEAHFQLGLIYALLERNQEALDSFKQVLRIRPDDAIAHFNIGIACKKLRRTQEEIDAFKQAIKISPDFAEAHFQLGLSYAVLERNKEALDSCKQAIRIKPDYAEVYSVLGEIYGQLGRHYEAIEASKQAIKLNPDNSPAYVTLGVAYSKLERHQESVDAFKQAIRIKPDHAFSHYALGVEYNILGNKGAALEEYRILKNLNSEMANQLFNSIYNDSNKGTSTSSPAVVPRSYAYTPPARVTQGIYQFVGGSHWIQKNIDSGAYILLEDGSLWEISSMDKINSFMWLPTSKITVIESQYGTPGYPYMLINTSEGQKASAKYIGNQ